MLDLLCKFSVILPPAGLCLLLLIARRRGKGWAESLFPSTVAWGILATILTEALTLARGLTRGYLILAWLLIDIFLLIYLRRMAAVTVAGDVFAAGAVENRESLFGRFAGLFMAVILSLTGVTALVAPPNSTDALNYHLPRIIFWLQNGSVAFYPTDDSRQLLQPPGAEYLILQFHALWGGDRFDNLVQWGAFLLCVIGVTQLVRQLGAGKRAQLAAAVFCATLPQAILQASGAKNDLVVSWWLIAACYYLLAFKTRPDLSTLAGLGGAAGLALLTKGTAYFFLLPLIMATILVWPRKSWLAVMRLAPVALVLISMLNLGHWFRSYRLTGALLQPSAQIYEHEYRFSNDKVTPASVASNVLRNLALHMQFPGTALTPLAEKAIAKVITITGEDVNDPSALWSFTRFNIPPLSRYENIAGNSGHLGLILITLPFLWGTRRPGRDMTTIVIALGLICGFMFFCAILRWQPWHTRLHLPLFVLWSAPIGVTLSLWPRRIETLLCALFFLLSLPWLMANESRAIVPWSDNSIITKRRADLYFARRTQRKEPFAAAAEVVNNLGCHEVGIQAAEAGDEYLLLRLLQVDDPRRRIYHVGVRNRFAQSIGDGAKLDPCAVICQSCSKEQIEAWQVGSGRVHHFAELQVIERRRRP